MGAGDRVFRDPIYGYISVDEPLIAIVDHRMFQRLRRISQTSLTSYVYPSATGSRFEHALGSMHLAGRAWAALWNRRGDSSGADRRAFMRAVKEDFPRMPEDEGLFGERMGLAFQAAALLHDVGHAPFSHALEEVYRTKLWSHDPSSKDPREREVLEDKLKFHEFCGRLIAERICSDVFRNPDDELVQAGLPGVILQVIDAGPSRWARALHRAISGHIDVDRIDYLIRDSHKAAGSEFGSIDYVRLLDALELHTAEDDGSGKASFLITPWVRARSAVETLLIQRLQAYEYIHFHPRVVGFNLALERATELFLELSEVENRGSAFSPIRVFFRRIRPNLVYWDADKIDASAALALWRPPRETGTDTQTSIEEVTDGEQFVERLRDAEPLALTAAAGVDDSTVLEALKQAYLIANTAPARYLPDPPAATDLTIRDDLNQLKIYSRAALFRRKNFVPAWKSVDEYLEAANEMNDSLLLVAPQSLRDKAASMDSTAASSLEAFALRIEQTGADLAPTGMAVDQRVNAVIALNTLVDLLLFRREMRESIRNRLNENPTIGDRPGVWDVAYTGSGPVEKLEVTLRSSGGQVSMVERSPLTEAVWFAEERRMKLAVFFFFENLDFSDPGSGAAGKLRGEVRDEAVARLPGVILDAIDDYV